MNIMIVRDLGDMCADWAQGNNGWHLNHMYSAGKEELRIFMSGLFYEIWNDTEEDIKALSDLGVRI